LSKGKQKAQTIPLDFMSGFFIFLLLVAYFLIQWDLFSSRFAERAQRGDLGLGAITISEMLVHTPGEPENWTQAPLSVKSVGLAQRQNLLDWNKVAAFSSLPYANAREALGTDHDFLVVIETPDGVRFASIGQDGNSTHAAEVTRVAVLNDTIVQVKVRLYD